MQMLKRHSYDCFRASLKDCSLILLHLLLHLLLLLFSSASSSTFSFASFVFFFLLALTRMISLYLRRPSFSAP